MTPSDIAIIHAALSGNPDPEVMRAWERVKEHVAWADESVDRLDQHIRATEELAANGHDILSGERITRLTADQRERIANTIAERFYLYDRFRETATFIPHDVAIAAIAEVCGKVEE